MLFYRAYEKKTVKQGHGNLIGAPAGQSFLCILLLLLSYSLLSRLYSFSYLIRSDRISLVILNNNPYLARFTDIVGIRLDCIVAFNNAVLNICIVTDPYIVQNDRVPDRGIVSDINLFEDHRIFDRSVYDCTARDQTVLHA